MCQQIVFGTDYDTRKFALGSGAEFLGKKSLFYGPVESYFAAYDSVVLTGPFWKEDAWAACLKVLVERPRRRPLQQLPPEALDVLYRCEASKQEGMPSAA